MLGKQVKCKITGFNRIATAKIEYINGCVQYCVKPKMEEKGKMPVGEYLDVEQLEVVGHGVVVESTEHGGDRKEIPRRN